LFTAPQFSNFQDLGGEKGSQEPRNITVEEILVFWQRKERDAVASPAEPLPPTPTAD
jgi:hypothetical protein